MPLLEINTNIHLDNSTVLAKQASKAIASMLGKPESSVMVLFRSDTALVFAGSDEAAAHLKLKSLALDEQKTADYSAFLCDFIHDNLAIEASRIYIEFSSPERHMWGWDSKTF